MCGAVLAARAGMSAKQQTGWPKPAPRRGSVPDGIYHGIAFGPSNIASTNSPPRSKAATSPAPCTWPGDGSRHQRSAPNAVPTSTSKPPALTAGPRTLTRPSPCSGKPAAPHPSTPAVTQPSAKPSGPHPPHAPPHRAPAPARSMARPHLLGDINPRATSDAGPGSAGYRPEPHARQIPDWARHRVAATTDRSQIPSSASP